MTRFCHVAGGMVGYAGISPDRCAQSMKMIWQQSLQRGLASAICFAMAMVAAAAPAQSRARHIGAEAQSRSHRVDPESRTAAEVQRLTASPAGLRAFLMNFPKGGDLHMHLSGAVYAETFLRNASQDNLCADPVKLVLLPNVGTTKSIPPRPVCAEGTVAASSAFTNQKLYDALVDSFSMRSFVPSAGVSGHDQFFATFGRFNGIAKAHGGEWLDEVATRAAAQNEQYLEIMTTPDFTAAAKLARGLQWTGDAASFRDALLKGGLRGSLTANRAELDDMEFRRNELERCNTPQAAPACTVKIRFLYQVLRANSNEQVFAHTLLGYELASADPRVVGINFVQPEDAYAAMTNYAAQMKMLQYLHTQYPAVHLSLHAGELAPGLVPPEGLRFHIHDAVEVAGAERIGHGVDIASETGSAALLREMNSRHIDVEINLTSNDVILGVSGTAHPLAMYRAAGVPFSLSTDDEGVSRIDLTNEYVRAVTDQHLDYAALKASARASLEHSFLPGETLNTEPDSYARLRAGCVLPVASAPVPSCAAFLQKSERAAQQYELERRFEAFEKDHAQ